MRAQSVATVFGPRPVTFRGDADTLARFMFHQNTELASIQSVRLDLDTRSPLGFRLEPKISLLVFHGLCILRLLLSLKNILVYCQDHYWYHSPSVILAELRRFFEAHFEGLPEPDNVELLVGCWQ